MKPQWGMDGGLAYHGCYCCGIDEAGGARLWLGGVSEHKLGPGNCYGKVLSAGCGCVALGQAGAVLQRKLDCLHLQIDDTKSCMAGAYLQYPGGACVCVAQRTAFHVLYICTCRG